MKVAGKVVERKNFKGVLISPSFKNYYVGIIDYPILIATNLSFNPKVFGLDHSYLASKYKYKNLCSDPRFKELVKQEEIQDSYNSQANNLDEWQTNEDIINYYNMSNPGYLSEGAAEQAAKINEHAKRLSLNNGRFSPHDSEEDDYGAQNLAA